MTLLLALSVLLASPCHLAAPEFFFRDLGAGVFLYTFCFCYIGASLGSRGRNIESVFQGPVPILFSCRMGRRGILKTWVLSLIPI
jgi:hypothetical protein